MEIKRLRPRGSSNESRPVIAKESMNAAFPKVFEMMIFTDD
jgi:hypothetical protein